MRCKRVVLAVSTTIVASASLATAQSLRVSIGTRETDTAVAIGENGGTSGSIEWVNASGVMSGAPQGVSLIPADGVWRTLTFDFANDPIAAFTGDGVVSTPGGRGTLEHLAFSIVDSTGPFVAYIDNVRQMIPNANPLLSDTEVLISSFEEFDVGVEAMFQEPGFSGSTGGDLTGVASLVSDEAANEGTQSIRTEWSFIDGSLERWLRLTTFNATNLPNPTIQYNGTLLIDVMVVPEPATILLLAAPAIGLLRRRRRTR